MRINTGTLMFNMNISSDNGGTPSWGTDLGESGINNYKFTYPDVENVITSLAYCSIPINRVYCPLGKGGSRQEDYEYVMAGLFNNIQVNGVLVEDAKFLLLIVKQIHNDEGFHIGRRTLKYSKNMTLDGEEVNKDCISKIQNKLGLNDRSAWFVKSIDFISQDTLNFNAVVCDEENPIEFLSTKDRKKYVTEIEKKERSADFKIAKNIILYGIPGCGKSYEIKEKYCDDDKLIERVVFHPDYAYSDFIGQILPTTVVNNGAKHIEYKFVPGPFTKILKKATEDAINNYYLIIEEINRGNAPAIFGDIFQLLDRKAKSDVASSGGSLGESVYSINNPDIAKEVYGDEDAQISLPDNLFILATMNTADQNVFTLDTAFKRRWEMKSIKSHWDKCDFAYLNICGEPVTWRDFVSTINEKIIDSNSKNGNLGSEDKRIGAFFLQENEILDKDLFSEKMLMYLWTDAFKYGKDVFKKEYKTLESLIEGFKKNGLKVFDIEFSTKCSDMNFILNKPDIPKTAYAIIQKLAEKNLLSEDMKANLFDYEYCKSTFNEQVCPYLAHDRNDNRTNSNKVHYNATPIAINGEDCYVSYEWFEEKEKNALIEWYKEIAGINEC